MGITQHSFWKEALLKKIVIPAKKISHGRFGLDAKEVFYIYTQYIRQKFAEVV
jgi:hypothetical protein